LSVDINLRAGSEDPEFEQLLAELSLQFIASRADDMDATLLGALRRIGEKFDLDRVTFFRILPSGMLIDPISWWREGFPPAPTIDAKQHFPWALGLLREGRAVCFSRIEEIPDPIDRASYRAAGIQSAITVPLALNGEIRGAVGYNVLGNQTFWTDDTLHRLNSLAAMFAGALSRQEHERSLTEALATVKRLGDQLAAENTYLRQEARERFGPTVIVGESPALRRVLDQVKLVAATDATVLLLGETGTGKELFASEIHKGSGRRAKAMVRLNCAAIPATLVESELFGREKGAFTGAVARQIGRFELADHSTIFLDEIGELSLEVQVKLLRVLEDRTIQRLGGGHPIPTNTRIITATHRNLEELVAAGQFREDLFYRLNVFPIVVPPLRERRGDIPLLIWRFVAEFSKAFGKTVESIPADNMAALQEYSWPGNIRELRNVVERAMIIVNTRELLIPVPTHVAERQSAKPGHSSRLNEIERDHIRHVLETTAWRIRGADGAAERLGLKPTTLESRLAKLGLKRPGAA
jgi:formate hydrogenlyase transcriptional activator